MLMNNIRNTTRAIDEDSTDNNITIEGKNLIIPSEYWSLYIKKYYKPKTTYLMDGKGTKEVIPIFTGFGEVDNVLYKRGFVLVELSSPVVANDFLEYAKSIESGVIPKDKKRSNAGATVKLREAVFADTVNTTVMNESDTEIVIYGDKTIDYIVANMTKKNINIVPGKRKYNEDIYYIDGYELGSDVKRVGSSLHITCRNKIKSNSLYGYIENKFIKNVSMKDLKVSNTLKMEECDLQYVYELKYKADDKSIIKMAESVGMIPSKTQGEYYYNCEGYWVVVGIYDEDDDGNLEFVIEYAEMILERDSKYSLFMVLRASKELKAKLKNVDKPKK